MNNWELDGGTKLRLLVAADVKLDCLPEVTTAGDLIVPENQRKEAERAIEIAANLIAVSEMCKRSISSPSPCIEFLPESSDERAWFEDAKKLNLEGEVFNAVSYGLQEIIINNNFTERLDGFALLAEALSQGHATGKLHELMRVFERAFARGGDKLINPLFEFLAGSTARYTKAEVRRWILDLRHPATHADRRDNFLLESDVRPDINRIQQAAYDVLFNKSVWRSPSTERRKVLLPQGQVMEDKKSLAWKLKSTLEIVSTLMDPFACYPNDLTAGLTTLPKEWWPKISPTPTPSSDSG